MDESNDVHESVDFVEPNDVHDSVDVVEPTFGVPCVPIRPPEIGYCYEGQSGYAQRIAQDAVCQPFAPSPALPPVCDSQGPVTEWDPVWLDGAGTTRLDVTCNLSDGCPEVVRQRSLTTTETDSGGYFAASRHFVLRQGAVLVNLGFSPSIIGGQSTDPRSYSRLAAISDELEFAWQTPDLARIHSVGTTPTGDVLLTGTQSTEVRHVSAGERSESRADGLVARLDQNTGLPRWVSHSGLTRLSTQAIRQGELHGMVSVLCEEPGPLGLSLARAAVAIDLDTGEFNTCRVYVQPDDTALGPVWVGDTPMYRTRFGNTFDPEPPLESVSTISPSGDAVPIVNNVFGQHRAAIKLADGTWLYPLGEWLRFDAGGQLLARIQPLAGREPIIPIIGYNDTTALADGGSPLTLVSTNALLDGEIDIRHEYLSPYVATGYRSMFAMQDGTWLAFGGARFDVVDDVGNVLWSAASAEVGNANFATGQVIDNEHIMVMISRSGSNLGGVRGDLIDFYIIRHVHGGVANSQHATYGYDIYKSWVPPENPVLEGPEIEPRWTLAE